MTNADAESPGPLAGLRVVEIAGGVPAAFCARQLRGFGADTIRVERVEGRRGPGSVLTAVGPRSHWQATNAVQFAIGGLMTLTGEPHRPPLVTGGEQALFLGGLHAFAATTVALTNRWRNGRGARIDLSMQEAAASMPEPSVRRSAEPSRP